MRSKRVLLMYLAAIGTALLLSPLALNSAQGAVLRDYCVKPPLIGAAIPPNLLMILDNSASMYDLTYEDTGTFGTCSSTGASCTKTQDCPQWNNPAINETCGAQITRTPTYCYDETYSSKNVYEGYFTVSLDGAAAYYSYDFTNRHFVQISSLPAASTCVDSTTGNSWYIANSLCMTGSSGAKTILYFAASGNYLNWLTMSKFDIQKKVLTGGKYNTTTQELIAESRGCVGRKYVKEAITADFVNFADGATDPNTSLGITFGVNGPTDIYNPSAPSPGGQTDIDIFLGNYNQQNCQNAINLYQSSSTTKQQLVDAVEQCLGYSATSSKACEGDQNRACTNDNGCYLTTTGTCGTGGNGRCGTLNQIIAGSCQLYTAGICSQDNGTCVTGKKCINSSNPGAACTKDADCPGGSCANKTCSGGGKAGAECSSDAQCTFSRCTAGDMSITSCTSNSQCDLKKCNGTGTAKDGLVCLTDTGCSYGICTAGKVGDKCISDANCNANVCSATSPAPYNDGRYCLSDAQCNDYVGPCLAPVTTQIKSTFAQTMNSCYQAVFKGIAPGQNEITQIANPAGCNQIYKSYFTCLGGARDGLQCFDTIGSSDCPAGTCIKGPTAIRPGSPVLVCSAEYAGYCARTSDDWNTTTWVSRDIGDYNNDGVINSDDCILKKYNDYCTAAQVVPVVDPSTPLSVTSNFANLPAIINDIGVEAQLGQRLATMTAKVSRTTEPASLLQQFGGDIRMGVMTFNLNGTTTECKVCTTASPCGPNDVPCPKRCSTSPDPNNPVMCSTNLDCPNPATATCDLLSPRGTATPANEDGAKILHYIGTGYCYNSEATVCITDANCATDQKCVNKICHSKTATSCVKAANCASGQACVSDGAGSHTSGLVKAVDDIPAGSWTPFSEAYYNAIGYFAKDPADATGQTSRTDLRINSTDFVANKNPSEYECQRNTILFITDGMSTADQNTNVMNLVNTYFAPSATITTSATSGACTQFSGSQNLDDLAYLAKNYDINTFSTTAKSSLPTSPLKRYQQVQTFVAFNGVDNGATTPADCNNTTVLTKTARNGGSVMQQARNYSALYQALNMFFQSIAADTVSGTAASVLASGEGSGANLVQAVFYPTRTYEQGSEVAWVGRLSNMWYFVDPNLGNSNIREDNGDPNLSDTTTFAGDKILNLQTTAASGDYITQLYFDTLTKSARAHRWGDSNGDGIGDSVVTPDIKVDEVANLWEAGKLLWSRGTGTSRTIWTYKVTGSAANNMAAFTDTNKSALRDYLGQSSDDRAGALIKWVRGDDSASWSAAVVTPYRQRQAIIGGTQRSWKLGDVLNSTPKISTWQPLNVYHTYTYYQDATYGPVSGAYESTPPSDSSYVTTYGYKGRGNVYTGANDGMLHAFRLGKLKLDWTGQDKTYQKARLANGTCSTSAHIYCLTNSECPSSASETCSGSATLGEEIWAYIPKNVLPYLQYMADPNYCHIYSVDLTPYIFDASITKPTTCGDADYSTCSKTAETWNTVLIGGMRLGGGCRKAGKCSGSETVCSSNSNCPSGETCSEKEACNGTDCVYTPMLDPANDNKGLGYSSYFALDITNQNNPKLLWEFDGTIPVSGAYKNYLGYATSGPAVVRINTKTSGGTGALDANGKQLNGKWFVVFGSGPTGPIDTANFSFMGRSDQNLRLFVFDLALGPGTNNSNVRVIDTNIPNAFAGNIALGTFDVDRNYADDVVYVPYIYKGSDGNFNNGGIGRLLTRENLDPTQWEWGKVIENTGAVTTGTAKLKRTTDSAKRDIWLYFGAGRFFYSIGNESDDSADPDPSNPIQRQLFGIKDPCVDPDESVPGTAPFLATCPAAITFCNTPVSSATCGGITNVDDVNVTKTIVVSDPAYKGWYLNMEPTAQYPLPETIDTKWYYRERTITDPAATQSGIVYFTSFRPYKDPCEMGGITHLWAMLYDTGGDPTPYLKGKAIIQVSTGSIEQVDLATAFTAAGHRKTAGIVGVPPTAQGISVMAAPGAVKRPVHIRER